MKSINKAELFFILPISKLIRIKVKLKEDLLLKKLVDVQKDEFSESLSNSISRDKVYDGMLSFQDHILPLKIYINNYNDYNSSLIYLKVTIDKTISSTDFINLIHGNNILNETILNNKSLNDYIKQEILGKTAINEIFLFSQIAETTPEFPSDYYKGLDFIEKNKQQIHQILLRSNTQHKYLRVDNHELNFKSIANFYGTVDLCSPITLLQFYQYPIKIEVKNEPDIDMNHRACWWLVITDMIFVQKSVLSDTLDKISQVEINEKRKTIKATTQISKVLLNMKDFWYLEDLSNEISKAVLNGVKEKIGITSMLNSVIERVEYLENMVLREINEEQNSHNYYLNIILLIIAVIQIVPIIYEILDSVYIENAEFSFTQLWLWIKAFAISIILPLLILVLRKVNERRMIGSLLAVKKTKKSKI